ncbi:MAG TPA: hypothetical protein VM242_10200 [Acidimicrobiales bacterium]|jgi:hypothetical protein|nr:hypothetical protein [Acidimicrobiales bacterium]
MSTNNPVPGEQVASDEPLGVVPDGDDEAPPEEGPEERDDS